MRSSFNVIVPREIRSFAIASASFSDSPSGSLNMNASSGGAARNLRDVELTRSSPNAMSGCVALSSCDSFIA